MAPVSNFSYLTYFLRYLNSLGHLHVFKYESSNDTNSIILHAKNSQIQIFASQISQKTPALFLSFKMIEFVSFDLSYFQKVNPCFCFASDFFWKKKCIRFPKYFNLGPIWKTHEEPSIIGFQCHTKIVENYYNWR